MKNTPIPTKHSRGLVLILLVLLLLVGLPVAVWLDLHQTTEASLLRQANDLNAVISSVRNYYTKTVGWQ
jgi:adenylate cyclase